MFEIFSIHQIDGLRKSSFKCNLILTIWGTSTLTESCFHVSVLPLPLVSFVGVTLNERGNFEKANETRQMRSKVQKEAIIKK